MSVIDTRARNNELKVMAEVLKQNGNTCICCGSSQKLKLFFPEEKDRNNLNFKNSALLCNNCLRVALAVNKYFKNKN